MDKNSVGIEESVSLLINPMIDRIANQTNAFFKSQQKDENDLTFTQKRLIAEQLFNDSKQVFLQRYGSYLSEEELKYFDQFNDNYVINSLLIGLRKILNKNKSKTVVKNRRFEALQTLIKKGEYFSDFEMQSRNPLLFDQMIGQYMSEEEKRQLTESKYANDYQTFTFSSFLLEQIDKTEIQRRYKVQEDIEDSMREEEEESESEDNDSDNQSEASVQPTNSCLDSDQKLRLREEFKKIMFEQFLTGKDSEFFDYSRVDYNNEYDSNEIEDRDEEEKYFDAEDSNQ